MSAPQLIEVRPGELALSGGDAVLTAEAGASLVVCMHAPAAGVGGLVVGGDPARLVREMQRATGARPDGLVAKILARSPAARAAGERCLAEQGVAVAGARDDLVAGQKLYLYCETGRVRVLRVAATSTTMSTSTTTSTLTSASAGRPGEPRAARRIRVMIIDDSATLRAMLRELVSRDPALEVVAEAPHPLAALEALPAARPDVITLDVHMPQMDGVTFLERHGDRLAARVVMITSISAEDGDTVLRAMELGAVDYIQKPSAANLAEIGEAVVEKIKAAAGARPRRAAPRARRLASSGPAGTGIVAIGASTGGTEALTAILTRLPAQIPPILVVQHIPPLFSKAFADRLATLCAFAVKEADDGDAVLPGRVLIAPGGRHMELVARASGATVRLHDGPKVTGHKPSVDALFHSVARQAGADAVGILLTGMGRDGAEGLLAMRRAGARTLAQDEDSSVVYGMPREAAELGAAELVRALDDIPGELMNLWTRRQRAG